LKLRNYQHELAEKGKLILLKYNLLYLAMEMRVGKTFIAFEIANLIKAKKVLFITKKRIISTVLENFNELGYKNLLIDFINYESIHKLELAVYDLIICDEAHTLGGFPKPSKAAKQLHNRLEKLSTRIIFLSGTPTPESYSQLYHQLWISRFTPFSQWPKFYDWAKAGFVQIVQKQISGYRINDYSHANKSTIDTYTKKLFLSYTQAEANFNVSDIDDEIKIIPLPDNLLKLSRILINDRVYTLKNGDVILCDTGVKLQQKLHQIFSGTVIVTTKEAKTKSIQLDDYKVNYILNNYKGKKIAIYYLYNHEGIMLKNKISPWTNDQVVFSKNKSYTFISQFQSGARGINLSSADVIVFFNIHFSSELYQQARQRGQEKDKVVATKLHWLFSDRGIEQKIYSRVIKKQSYTQSYFRKDYL